MLSGGVDKQHPTVIALAEKLRVSWLTAQASNTFALVKLKKKHNSMGDTKRYIN